MSFTRKRKSLRKAGVWSVYLTVKKASEELLCAKQERNVLFRAPGERIDILSGNSLGAEMLRNGGTGCIVRNKEGSTSLAVPVLERDIWTCLTIHSSQTGV
jgi:hypothetical protein